MKTILFMCFFLTSMAYGACEPMHCGKVDKCFVGGKVQMGPTEPKPFVKFAMCKFKGEGNLFIYDTRNVKHRSAIKGGKVCAQVCGSEDRPEIIVLSTKRIGPTPSSVR